MPKVTHDTFQRPDGAWSYRLLVDGSPCLTSGGFLFREDADRVGARFADDPAAVLDFLKR